LKTQVFELDLQGENRPKPLPTLELLEHTSLAACIGVKSRRFVAYQLATGFIEIYELEKASKFNCVLHFSSRSLAG
jgi:hypothetical protein